MEVQEGVSTVLMAILVVLVMVPVKTFTTIPSIRRIRALVTRVKAIAHRGHDTIRGTIGTCGRLSSTSGTNISGFSILTRTRRVLNVGSTLTGLGIRRSEMRGGCAVSSSCIRDALGAKLYVVTPDVHICNSESRLTLVVSFICIKSRLLGTGEIVIQTKSGGCACGRSTFDIVNQSIYGVGANGLG